MTLLELSAQYAAQAAVLHRRITDLRGQVRQAKDLSTAAALRQRVCALLPLWYEAKELAAQTAHYYDRSVRHEEARDA